MYYLADFSIGKYVKNELTNESSIEKVNSPNYAPKTTVARGLKNTAYLSSVGTGKYFYDNKLNRRQKKQVDKYARLFKPYKKPEPKPNFFNKLNPFAKPVKPNSSTV
jgi:hypothetical protein